MEVLQKSRGNCARLVRVGLAGRAALQQLLGSALLGHGALADLR